MISSSVLLSVAVCRTSDFLSIIVSLSSFNFSLCLNFQGRKTFILLAPNQFCIFCCVLIGDSCQNVDCLRVGAFFNTYSEPWDFSLAGGAWLHFRSPWQRATSWLPNVNSLHPFMLSTNNEMLRWNTRAFHKCTALEFITDIGVDHELSGRHEYGTQNMAEIRDNHWRLK